MIKVKTITITQAEGRTEDCDKPQTFTTWEAASEYARVIAERERRDQGEDGGGYYKTDLMIEFENGEIYEGRLDIKADGSDTDVAAHVVEFLTFYAGVRKPSHMNENSYKEYIGSDPQTQEMCVAMLKAYAIPGGEKYV